MDPPRGEPPLRRKAPTDNIYYTGSRAQLLEAEIIGPDDPLPGDQGQLRTYVRYPDDDPRRIRRIYIVRARPTVRFTVRVARTQDEIDANDRLLAYQTMMAMAGLACELAASQSFSIGSETIIL